MKRIHVVMQRIGTPDSVSWPVFWITFVAASIGNFVTNTGPVPLGLRVAVLLVGQAVLWLPLVAIGPILRRNPEGPRPALVISAFAVGLVARTVAVSVIYSFTVGPEEARWLLRLSTALLNIAPAFFWPAYILNVMRERRRQIASLEALQSDLERSVDSVSAGVVRRNEEAIERVRNVLLGELAALDANDARGSLEVLQRTTTEVVHPLSRELAQGFPDVTGAEHAADPAEIAWPRVIDKAASGSPFRPALTVLLMAFPMVGGVIIHPDAAMGTLTAAFALGGAYWLANLLVRPFLTQRPLPRRVVALIVAAVAASAVSGVVILVALSFTPLALAAAAGLTIGSTFVGLGIVVIIALGRDREQVIVDLRASSQDVKRHLVRLRQTQWFQQKALSRALHGPVQTAVNASAIRLDAALQEGDVAPEVIEQVRADLLRTIDVLNETEATVVSLELGLERIVGTWEGICAVTVDAPNDVAVAVSDNPVLRSCVIDILTEAIGNSITHGGSTAVTTSLAVDDESKTLRLVVDGNGERPLAENRSGLGSQLLNDCSLEWHRNGWPHGQSLLVLLPVT